MSAAKPADDKDPAQNRFLSEGCCPNRHGPMVRLEKNLAACLRCDTFWRSKRVEVIFPKHEEASK